MKLFTALTISLLMNASAFAAGTMEDCGGSDHNGRFADRDRGNVVASALNTSGTVKKPKKIRGRR